MIEFGPTVVRISCFGYAKNIPIEYNYKKFVEVFKKTFEIDYDIGELKFDLYFYKNVPNIGVRYVTFELDNEENYQIAFTSENNMKMQFSEVTGKAIFKDSTKENKTKKSDPTIQADRILNVKPYKNQKIMLNNNNNENYNNNQNNNVYKNINFNKINNSSYNEKKKKIEQLKKEINKLKDIYKEEKVINEQYKNQEKQNIGLDQINEIEEVKKNYDYHIDEPSQKIPYEIKAKRKITIVNKMNENLEDIKFLNKENKGNIITINISEIKKENPIIYTVKILKQNLKERWPEKDTLLYCVPDDADIYFHHVKINDELKVKKTKLNDSIQYDFKIDIKFKNYKDIIPGEKRLNAKIICDSENKINKDVGTIILSVEKINK